MLSIEIEDEERAKDVQGDMEGLMLPERNAIMPKKVRKSKLEKPYSMKREVNRLKRVLLDKDTIYVAPEHEQVVRALSGITHDPDVFRMAILGVIISKMISLKITTLEKLEKNRENIVSGILYDSKRDLTVWLASSDHRIDYIEEARAKCHASVTIRALLRKALKMEIDELYGNIVLYFTLLGMTEGK